MRADQADGLPAIGETGRYLGVRPGVDILVAAEGHGFIEPARRVSFEEYRRAIHQTRTLWRRLRRDMR